MLSDRDYELELLRERLTQKAERPMVRADSQGDWRERQPLPDARVEVPNLPVDLIPAPLRDWLADSAERLQVPPEMVAVPAMVSACALVGRRIGIHPKRRDDWLVVPNLWGMLIERPGTLKTPAMEEGMRPLRWLAGAALEEYKHAAKSAAVEAEEVELKIAALKNRGRKAGVIDFKSELQDLLDTKERLQVRERRYLTQDPTVEKLGELLNQNPRGVLLLRDELSGWINTLHRQGREGERQFYLEGWNGLGGFTVDRIGRGTLHVPALTISVFGTIQPAKLADCLAINNADGGDGLLQRFSLTVWPQGLTTWRNVDRFPETGARDRAFNAFKRLDGLDPQQVAASMEHSEIPALRFHAAAQDLFDAWREELETRLRSPELVALPAFEGHLAKYRKAMPALALIAHLLDVVDGGVQSGPVSLDAAKRAAAWCEFLEAHARKLYGIDNDPARRAVRALAAKMEGGAVADGEPVRELYRPHWSGLNTPDLVDAALVGLAVLGWLRLEDRDTGGRPSRVVRLHPDFLGGAR